MLHFRTAPEALRSLIAAAGLVLLAFVLARMAHGEADPNGDRTPTAEEMMRRAHRNRAVWEDFPGFTAELVLASDGERVDGTITVTDEGEIRLEFPESADVSWAQRVLESFVRHRQPVGDRKWNAVFADEVTEHPLGWRIRLEDDSLESVYRIEDGVVREVRRTMEQTRFTITVLQVTRNSEGKYLPHLYTVSWWDRETGDLTSTLTVQDEWVRVGGFDLPARILRIKATDEGRQQVRELRLADHRLLKTEAKP